MDNLKQFNHEFTNLEILSEEAAEVIQAKSKIIRFGIDDNHPDYKPAKAHLEIEIGHFLALVNILTQNGTLSRDNIEVGVAHKIKRLMDHYRPCEYARILRGEARNDV